MMNKGSLPGALFRPGVLEPDGLVAAAAGILGANGLPVQAEGKPGSCWWPQLRGLLSSSLLRSAAVRDGDPEEVERVSAAPESLFLPVGESRGFALFILS